MNIVVAYRGIPEAPGWETGASLSRAFEALGHRVWRYGTVYRAREEHSARPEEGFIPDLLIAMECNDGDRQYDELFEFACPKCYWEFDTAMHAEWSCARAERFDRTFLANPRYAVLARSNYLPYAFDPHLLRPIPNVEKGSAAIVGTAFPQRQAFADQIGVPLITGKYREEYAQAVTALRVHVHHYDSGGEGLIVGRIWETMGLGTCLLTEASNTLSATLSHGYVTYHNVEECREKLTALLAGDPETIGAEGRRIILAKHTYVHRARAILQEMRL